MLAACASFAPNPRPDADFMQRTETQERSGLRVSVSVPTRSESRAIWASMSKRTAFGLSGCAW